MTNRPRPARRAGLIAAACTAALVVAGCGGGGFEGDQDGAAGLEMLVGSSGDAELQVVRDLVAQWSEQSGTPVTVTPAQELNQQLGQAFAGGNPPDLFYLDSTQFARYAESDSLFSYGAQLSNPDDFYPTLTEGFTTDGELVCAPKDFSTLGLIIDEAAWEQAGLTDADIPTTWDQLAAVAQRLTTPERTGLVFDPSRDRIGAFMRQAGGWFLNDDATEATADSQQNVQALQFVQQMLQAGSLRFSPAVDAGWGGEALGEGKAAMTIEGNWIVGAFADDYPDARYRAVELPAGPAGKGTLAFTNCWGVPSASSNAEAAADLAAFLTQPTQQVAQADAFGVLPSRESAAVPYGGDHPELAAFVAGGEYAQPQIGVTGFDAVLADFDAQIPSLATGADPAQLLATVQRNATAALGG